MTSRGQMQDAIRSLYEARVRGDLDASLKDVADDALYSFNGRGTGHPAMSEAASGKQAVRAVIQQLIDAWRFDEWREQAFVADGDTAVLRWTVHATFVPSGKSADFEVVDIFRFRDGKIVEFRQSTDTALVASLAS